ncbi:aldo/keto reductase [Streptomyces sp. Tue6028]|uniref:aldo/keto reductase n=1 Tax=Streptomyces sp. Tue6028 TaxID=2036037 RepID=UPI003EBA106F
MSVGPGAFTLNNGVTIPSVGLGVFQSSSADTLHAVETALRDGYRLIDTASAYGNEAEVGEALRRSAVDRGDVFVTTKLWLRDYGYDATLRAFDASMDKLGLDVLDLYLIHQPVPPSMDVVADSYRAMEKLLAEGRIRAIGVCNHTPVMLEDLMDRTEIVPAVNQVELHPHFVQEDLRTFHRAHSILTQAWSPIGGISRYRPTERTKDPLTEPVITRLAGQYGKTSAQVILRWHLQRGVCVIPKSVHDERIAENLDVFDFSLTPDEVESISALDTGVRGGPNPESITLDSFS